MSRLRIYILDSRKHRIDPEKVTAAANRMKIDVYFSEFSFCPYLYSYKDEKQQIVYMGNLNEGAVEKRRELSSEFEIIESVDLEDFIRSVFSLKFGELETNALF